MKGLDQLLAVGIMLGTLSFGWMLWDLAIAGPLNAVKVEVEGKQAELDALVERGEQALGVLESTQARPALPTTPLGATDPLVLQEVLRNVTLAAGGTLISSQSGANGEVLIRARFDERALLEFTRNVEGMAENYRFQTFEVQPVPVVQGTTVLEMTAMIRAVNSNAN